jgi:Ca2+-binding RTX toxin-like protein
MPIFNGTTGNDSLPGAGADNSQADELRGLEGNDTLRAGGGNDLVDGGVGNDVLEGGAGNDTLAGGADVDTADYSYLTTGLTATLAASGNTTVTAVANSDVDILSDIENLVGGSGNDSLTGNDSANALGGGAGNDTLRGAGGNDSIYGDTASASTESGADSIDGGDGDDLIVGGRGNDVLVGGAGNDTLSYQDETRDVTITYSAPTVSAPTMTAAIAGGEVDTVSGFEAFVGGAGNDTFRHVKTTLSSLSLPAVSYDGGAGRDTLDLSRLFDDATQEQISGGIATIRLAFGSQQKIIETLGANARAEHLVLSNIENVIGTKFNDSISGTTADNRIDGGAGDDTIRGEGGADTLIGGSGNDEFYISSRDAVIIELDGEGVDTVYADTTYFKIGANIENLVLRETGLGIGNAAANVITGSGGGDTLEGGAGADTIDGGSGNDFATYRSSLNGVVVRLRDDTVAVAQVGGDAQGDILINIEHLEGSAFADILTGNSRDNILIGGAGNDVLDGGAGFDWADYRSSASGVEIDLRRDAQVGGDAQGDAFLSIEGVRGSAFNDVLTGNASDNVFDGAAGADVIDGQGGIDTVTYANSTRDVSVSLRGDRTGTGGDAEGDRWIGIENVVGSSFDDTIEAGNAQGVVYSLDGGNGRDVLSFANADAGAVVNLGISKAQSTGTGNGSVILSRIEGVQGSRFADTLTGSGSNEELWGGDGNDSVSGGQGVDRLTGGAGNDILSGDRLAGVTDRFFQDTFVFVTGGGNDTITDFAVGTGSRDFDVLDFSAFGFGASDLVLSSGSTVGVSVGEFNANNYRIALMERATATSDYQIMYRDGESTATLTLKYNQAIAWDAKFFDFTP